jgi:hypothetical protein
MTGPEHHAEAERLLALADRHTRGVTYDQEWTLTLAAAQVHATLALAAATAVGTAGPDGHAWADVAATRLSARKPEPSSDSSRGFDPHRGTPRLCSRQTTGRAYPSWRGSCERYVLPPVGAGGRLSLPLLSSLLSALIRETGSPV